MRALIVAGISVLILAGCREQTELPSSPDARPKVGTMKVAERTFEDRLRVQGTVRVRNSSVVSARVPGSIDEIYVEEGAQVTNGAALFRVDHVNLENAVNQARAARASAAAVIGEAEAALEKAKWDDARMRRLFEGKAVTKDAFEKARLQFKSVSAKVEAARAQLAQSEAAVKSAEKTFGDSIARAPFSGTITKKFKDAGDYVAPGVPVFSMDDPSVRELCVSLPAAHYGKVKIGRTLIGLGGTGNQDAKERRLYPVSYKAPSVDPLTRTFEIRCVLEGGYETHVPGMVLNGEVVFGESKTKAVPEAAVGVRRGRQVVFVVRAGKIVAVPVKTGARSDGWIAVEDPDLSSDDIVAEGMLLLNEGEEVRGVSE